MLSTFAISFRLRNTYRVNGIIYSLKSLPLIKRLLPASLYASRGLKGFANVVSAIYELLTAFTGKALYLGFLCIMLDETAVPPAEAFFHSLIFLTVIGGFMNTSIFNPTKDKYYAIFCMRMDARRYVLTDYCYFLLKMLAGFLVFSLIFGRLLGAPVLLCLALPVLVVCVKLCFAALSVRECEKADKALNENKLTPVKWVSLAVLLAAAFLPPFLGYAVSGEVFCAVTAAALVPAALALRYILRFRGYKSIYKQLLTPQFVPGLTKDVVMASQQLAMQKKISADVSQTSDKSGYKYFNELFMKRHAKLLTRSAKRITAGAAIVFAGLAAATLAFPEMREAMNEFTLTFLPYFLFIMYVINRGKGITQAMFMNCDHSMLTYRFYRQPRAILSLFVDRLKYVVLINLMPAAVIALGLPLLLYVSGGTDEPVNYLLLFVSIISMSVFFSVHNMVLYYIFQPYNLSLESKSAAYNIISTVTYFLCYIAIGRRIPTLAFGTAITAFCVIYAAAATVLAYRLAPRTFKLR